MSDSDREAMAQKIKIALGLIGPRCPARALTVDMLGDEKGRLQLAFDDGRHSVVRMLQDDLAALTRED